MTKIKMYECIIDSGDHIYKEICPAKNKKELLSRYGGNGEFKLITDVTEEYKISMKTIMDGVSNRFGVAEQRLLSYILEQFENIVDDYH